MLRLVNWMQVRIILVRFYYDDRVVRISSISARTQPRVLDVVVSPLPELTTAQFQDSFRKIWGEVELLVSSLPHLF
jgi:hypothetical protein